MNNLIPKLIHDNYINAKYNGRFYGATMFMDISGFTAMTETLMNHGKEGAEVLSGILNSFSPVIDAVHDAGGVITGFAGDAFTAVFTKKNNALAVLYTAEKIRNVFLEHGSKNTRFGDFNLFVKMGIGFGNVSWGIVGLDKHKTYYFKGAGIDNCTGNEKKCTKMEIIFDTKIQKKLLAYKNTVDIEYDEFEDGCFKLKKINLTPEQYKSMIGMEVKHESELTNEVLLNFFTPNIINFRGGGELRDIVSIFISFREINSYKQINEMACTLITQLDSFGGYLKNLDFGDKGATMLIVFGAPVSYEKNISRAINFVLAIRKKYKTKIRAGITYGTVYAGLIGSEKRGSYDVLGDTVNISSRIMMVVNWGNVWMSQEVFDRAKDEFNIDFVDEFEVRGRTQTVMVYKLVDKKNIDTNKLYKDKIIGRDYELAELKKQVNIIFQNKNAGIVYIYGEAGIGKSRLVDEVLDESKNANCLVLQCDSILRKSLNPVVFFLRLFFLQAENLNIDDRENNFKNKLNEFLEKLKSVDDNRKKNIVKEVIRTKSFIKALLGLSTANTIYESIEPKLILENTISAIKSLVKGLSLIQPLILELEDIQWIDDDSIRLFEALTINVEDYPYIIIATSRYNDDGSKPKLIVDSALTTTEFELTGLDKSSIELLIKNLLHAKPDEKLIAFISERTQSNPFYVEQFCMYLLENNFLRLKDDVYYLAIEPAGIPNAINFILTARIDRLPSDIKEFAQIASVIGREFDITVSSKMLESITSLIEIKKSIANYVQEILYDGKKVNLWNDITELKYMFKHALLAQTIHDMQLRSRLRQLHKTAADIILSLYYGNPNYYADIAYHYTKAEVEEKAKIYLEKAADYFKKVYQNDDAIHYYEKLLSLTTDIDKRIRIIINQAEIFILIGKWDDAIELLTNEINAKPDCEPLLLGKMKNLLAEVLENKGEYETAMTISMEAKSIVEQYKYVENLEAQNLYSEIIANIGSIYYDQGDYEKAMESFTEQKNSSKITQNNECYLRALDSIGSVHHDLGEYDEAMKYYTEGKDLAHKLGDKKNYLIAVGSIGLLYLDKGEYDDAMKFMNEQKELAEEIGDRRSYSEAVGNIGSAYLDLGDYAKAMQCFEEDKSICKETGEKKGLSTAIGNLGSVYGSLGDYDNALKCFIEDCDLCKNMGDKYGYAIALGNVGSVFLAKGEFDEALNCYKESIKIYKSLGTKRMYSLAIYNIASIYQSTGDYKKSLEYYDEAITIARELDVKFYLCTYLRRKAETLFEIKDFQGSETLVNEALKIATEIGELDDVFRSNVLKTKLLALKNKEQAVSEFLNMLSENDVQPKQIAQLHYEIWQLLNDEEHKNKALQMYQEFYKKTPKYDYKKYINEMKTK